MWLDGNLLGVFIYGFNFIERKSVRKYKISGLRF